MRHHIRRHMPGLVLILCASTAYGAEGERLQDAAAQEQKHEESASPRVAPPQSPAPPQQPPLFPQTARDFALHCQGCHTPRGEAVAGWVPALRDSVGVFLHTPEGRAFLVQVPGIAFAPLEDQRLAELLNWMVQSLSAAQLPAAFVPYSAAEVAAYRRQALVDVDKARAQVVAQLVRKGLPAPDP